jgi:uncharacterized protein
MTSLLDTVLDTIRARRDEIEARYGIRLLGVVGSVARGEERPDSDVDITFELTGHCTLFKLSNAQFELEDILKREVDLIDLKTVRPEGRAWMEEDLVLV